MRELARAVIDTNTFVSAVLAQSSVPARAVEKALQSGLVMRSEATWRELEEVLMRPRFERYQKVAFRRRYLLELDAAMEMISVLTTIAACRDLKDDKFLELAVDGRAEVIITGDLDLLELHPFQGIEILTPMDYLGR
jgi:putative PIN family toxin of toxin-antitoxin system